MANKQQHKRLYHQQIYAWQSIFTQIYCIWNSLFAVCISITVWRLWLAWHWYYSDTWFLFSTLIQKLLLESIYSDLPCAECLVKNTTPFSRGERWMNRCWEKKERDPDVKCKCRALLIARCALAFAANRPPKHVEEKCAALRLKPLFI